MDIDKNLQINLVSCLFKKAFIGYLRTYVFDLLLTLSIFLM
jgi:hypothetical protein